MIDTLIDIIDDMPTCDAYAIMQYLIINFSY
jgi:hypothetical protein